MIKFACYLILMTGIIFATFSNDTLPPYIGDGKTRTNLPEIRNQEEINITLPSLEIPSLNEDSLPLQGIGESGLSTNPLQIVSIQSNVDSIKNNFILLNKLIMDKRNMYNDNDFLNPENEIVEKWIKVYNEEYPEIEKIELPHGVRMIAEVRMPQSIQQSTILKENLEYRKTQGFNSVLLTFNGTESPEDLYDLAIYLKNFGFSVWFAFGGKEDLNEKVFIDPDKYAYYLYVLSTVCDGFISHWRRTSSHLFIQDDVFMEFSAYWVRTGNASIPILGEIYFGETADLETQVDWCEKYRINQRGGTVNLIWRLVDGGSGYLITNFSSGNINVEWVMTNILKKIEKPKYVLITGPNVYFLTVNLTNSDYEKDFKIIEQIEERWIKAGCIGTIVTHGDGSDTFSVTDNMSMYHYKQIKK